MLGALMGTIHIEEFAATGSEAERSTTIPDLRTLITTTKDATTSSSAENITLSGTSKVVSVYSSVGDHRVCVVSDTTATTYAFVPASTWRDFGVVPGDVLYYELDA